MGGFPEEMCRWLRKFQSLACDLNEVPGKPRQKCPEFEGNLVYRVRVCPKTPTTKAQRDTSSYFIAISVAVKKQGIINVNQDETVNWTIFALV